MKMRRFACALGLLALGASAARASEPMSPAAAPPPAQAEVRERSFTRREVTSIIAEGRRIVAPNGVEELLEVSLGGTRQWISVRGRDRSNPVLLLIHGGPAAPEMPASWFFQNGWEDYFTVVEWDQRGSGKSYGANDPAIVRPTLTLERMVGDAGELVELLRHRYAKPKIFVLGHSWGSVLGLEVARRHPDWLYAYIGTGQFISGQANERVGYAETLQAAGAAGNARAVAELKAIAPYPEADGSLPMAKIGKEREWSVRLGGLTYNRDTFSYYSNLESLSPDYTEADVAAIDKGSALSVEPILPVLAHFDASRETRFGCPILLFEGRHDATTPAEVAAKWLAQVRAPAKKLVWFENSAHMALVEEPGRFLVHLVEDARPYAQSRPAKPSR